MTGNFADNTFLDISDPDCNVDVDRNLQELNTPINLYTLKPELGLEPSINTDTADFASDRVRSCMEKRAQVNCFL